MDGGQVRVEERIGSGRSPLSGIYLISIYVKKKKKFISNLK
jgi:hypothetical protein